MNIIATICNRRPDLLEIQARLCIKLCTDQFTFVVGVAKRFDVGDLSQWSDIRHDLESREYSENVFELADHIDRMNPSAAIYLEEDVLPIGAFSFDMYAPVARHFQGQPVYTMRKWCGNYPPENHWDEIDAEYAEANLLMGELLDGGRFYHLDKSSHILPRWFQDEKWARVKAIADAHGVPMPAKSWARIEREQTSEEIARHEAAVEAAYGGNLPEIQVGSCKGCGN